MPNLSDLFRAYIRHLMKANEDAGVCGSASCIILFFITT